MPMMKLGRNYTLTSLSGHTVGFTKDVPIYVVPAMVSKALEIGATAVDAAAETQVQDELKKLDEPGRKQEPQGVARDGQIKEVLEQIATRNKSSDFTAGNKPKLDIVNAELDGFAATGEERDRLWDEVLHERAEVESGS